MAVPSRNAIKGICGTPFQRILARRHRSPSPERLDFSGVKRPNQIECEFYVIWRFPAASGTTTPKLGTGGQDRCLELLRTTIVAFQTNRCAAEPITLQIGSGS